MPLRRETHRQDCNRSRQMKTICAILLAATLVFTAQRSLADENGQIGSIPGSAFEAVDIAVQAVLEANPDGHLSDYDILILQYNDLSIVVSFIASDEGLARAAATDSPITEYFAVVSLADHRLLSLNLMQ